MKIEKALYDAEIHVNLYHGEEREYNLMLNEIKVAQQELIEIKELLKTLGFTEVKDDREGPDCIRCRVCGKIVEITDKYLHPSCYSSYKVGHDSNCKLVKFIKEAQL